MSERIKRLRERLFEQEPKICSERCKIFTNSMKRDAGLPVAIRRANAFYDVLDQMTVWVKEDELIVGNQAKWPKASPIYPEYSNQWILDEMDGKPYKWDERPGDKFYADEDVKQDLRDCIEYWKDKALFDSLRKTLPSEINAAWDAGVIDDTWVSGAGLGNEIVDYRLVIQKGLKDVIARIEAKIATLDPKQPDNVKKLFFLRGALRGNLAVVNFARRIANKCEEEAKNAKTDERKKELLNLADICRNVPLNPAKTFHEAVQAIYIILLAVHLESNGHAISLGRFDQYVYPFYKNDIENGVLTREKALEIIECFYIKCNELNKLRSWPDSEFFLGYQMFINLAVAGQTKDGEDATNEVSYLCVEACENLKLVTPSVSVKWFEKTPDDFMMRALEATTIHQGGMPAFYND
ncbi:MAG: pyruvate formate lyase family protein, partial [Oscillospiraceae bacterium]